jgi:MoaE-MoaD fusion protein
MQIRVLFFGVLKDLAGRSSDSLTLPDEATAGDVLQHYETAIASLKGKLSSIAVSVNQEYAGLDARLRSGDEVALLPPVSGGLAQVAIVRERIDTAAELEKIKQPEDGAAVVFEGIVRNHSSGRRTLFLDYEAYEEMAQKQMESLAEQALAQFQIRDVALVHRLGRLEIGETSVLIIVASAHRTAAFEACRWLIDALKRTVPVWKKEHFEDGAVWADGEPFPERVAGSPSATGTQSRGASHPSE